MTFREVQLYVRELALGSLLIAPYFLVNLLHCK
jgi:hypothetical protein